MRAAAVLSTGAFVLMLCACATDEPSRLYRACATCPTTVTASTVTPATATILSVTILPDIREMKVSDTAVFYAQVEMSPGIPPPGPPPSWRIDNPEVATVEQGGKVTPVTVGQLTLSVNFRGVGATRLLRVVP
jgi:uncharacterized protein YjdB